MLDILYLLLSLSLSSLFINHPKKWNHPATVDFIYLELQNVFCQVIPWNVFADAQARMTDQSHQDFWVNLLDMVHDLNQVAHLKTKAIECI